MEKDVKEQEKLDNLEKEFRNELQKLTQKYWSDVGLINMICLFKYNLAQLEASLSVSTMKRIYAINEKPSNKEE